MNQEQREEIIEYAAKEPSFYNWKEERYEEVGSYSFFPYVKKHTKKCNSLLEVGCGNGKTLNRVSDRVDCAYGLDNSQEHCRLAREENGGNENVEIVRADAYSEFPISRKFNLAMTERGPINGENIDLVRDSLKENGVVLVEVIGEQDERVFKEIMGHGQGYGDWDKKSRSSKVREMLENNGFEPMYVHNHFYFHYYRDIVGLFKNHYCTPAIEFKINDEEMERLKEVEERLKTEKGIKMLRHRVVYAGRKK